VSTLRRVVLDTSAFIQGYNLSSEEEYYTVPEVLEEIREELGILRYEGAKASGKLKETRPDTIWVKEIDDEAKSTGEAHKLSQTDKKLLALGLQLKTSGEAPTIISDDYSVQNMASRLGLRFASQATRGIKRVLEWSIYCPGCRKSFNSQQEDNICPVCGTELKRKPKRG
jgi:endoribonuclease Nob1